MKHGISLLAVGHASSLFLAITFSLCVAFDLLSAGRPPAGETGGS